jgi:hypothetical protein
MIEEYERPHHTPLHGWQDAPNFEAPQTPSSLVD